MKEDHRKKKSRESGPSGVSRRDFLTGAGVGAVGLAAGGAAGAAPAAADTGAQVVAALPTNFFRALFRRIDIRNHRKLVVIDNETEPRKLRQEILWNDAAWRLKNR